MPKNKGRGYYAVRRGRETGVYSSWDECEGQVKGYSNSRYKRFSSRQEAEDFAHGEDDGYSGGYSGYSGGSRGYSSRSGGYASAAAGSSSTVYTDGACRNNGRSGARAGVGVYWGPDSEYNVSERLPGRQTNNRAEIYAATRGIQQAKAMGHSQVTVKTDSKFLVDSTTKWMDGWKRRNWQLSSGGPVKNKEDFVALDEEMRGISVKWQHVRGHSGEPGNEAADSLAVRGARKKGY